MQPLRFNLALLVFLALSGVSGCWGNDPLYEAVKRQDAAEVERLLDSGADPNRVTTYTQSGHAGATFRFTPLMIAAQQGDVPMIERLVAAGADPHWDDGQFTAFEWAIRFAHPEAARRLWELSDGSTYAARGAIHIPLAMRMGDTATLDFVLEKIGVEGCDAAAALQPLARSFAKGTEGEIRYVQALLERGVHPTPEALHWAVRQARPAMVNLLLDYGEQVGWLTDCLAKTPNYDLLAGPLRMSISTLEIDMVKLLLERGADPNARDAQGITPVMRLARDVYLKEVYARPPYQAQTLPSPSAYHHKWFLPLLDLLLEHGADLSLRDPEGRTAADYVPEDDHDRVIKRELLRAPARSALAS